MPTSWIYWVSGPNNTELWEIILLNHWNQVKNPNLSFSLEWLSQSTSAELFNIHVYIAKKRNEENRPDCDSSLNLLAHRLFHKCLSIQYLYPPTHSMVTDIMQFLSVSPGDQVVWITSCVQVGACLMRYRMWSSIMVYTQRCHQYILPQPKDVS